MNVATVHARIVLAAMSLAALLVLVSTLASPVAAQEETTAQPTNETRAASKDRDASGQRQQSVQGGGQQADEGAGDETDDEADARAADALDGAAVTIESDAGGTVNRIEIAAADCVVGKGDTVTVEDGDGDAQTFTDTGDVVAEGAANIEATEDQVLITDIEDELNNGFGTPRTGEVTDSSDIECDRDDGGAGAGDDEGNNAKDDDLENLSCAELLVLFRSDSSSGQQYGDAVTLADPEVRARIEVCLEKEIVQGTAADGDLPETGGLSLIGLAALGVATAVAGLSVIRGGRR